MVNRLAGSAEIAVRLVEVSSTLAQTQAQTLGVRLSPPPVSQSDGQERVTSPTGGQSDGQERLTSPSGNHSRSNPHPATSPSQSEGSSHISGQSGGVSETTSRPAGQWPLSGVTGCGRTVTWHDRLTEVPEAFSLVVANEFFDALPVHQFRVSQGCAGLDSEAAACDLL